MFIQVRTVPGLHEDVVRVVLHTINRCAFEPNARAFARSTVCSKLLMTGILYTPVNKYRDDLHHGTEAVRSGSSHLWLRICLDVPVHDQERIGNSMHNADQCVNWSCYDVLCLREAL